MLSFSGTLVERDSRIAFAAMLDDFRGRSIEGVGQDAAAPGTTSKDFADAELKKERSRVYYTLLSGKVAK